MTLWKVTIKKETSNVLQSVYHFLKYATYISSGASFHTDQTIEQHYDNPQLNIRLGYPEVGDRMTLPTIAIEAIDVEVVTDETYGETLEEVVRPYVIHGFSGGENHDSRNKEQRINLMNDLKQLLEDSGYMYYHNYPNFDSGSDLEIRNVRANTLPILGTVDAQRYRFQIMFDLAFIRNEW